MAEALRLFLIEDDDDMALLLRKSLERNGCHVTRCRTAADALIVLSQDNFDLVLLDQKLPDMPGLELLQTLVREEIAVPVLMVTAHGDEHLATQALRAGALDYIVKEPSLSFLADLPKRVRESVTYHRLQNLNRLLLTSLESTRDGILITDLAGSMLHLNQAVEAMSGYDRNELIGKHPRSLRCVVHPPHLFDELCPTILGRASWQGEASLRRKGGSLVEVSLTVSPIVTPQGQLTHFVAILRDITERKHLEQQLLQAQKMQSVGTLAGGVAHEFNNLLAGIHGYAALGLREAGVPEQAREFLQQIVTLSERAAILTRQLLTFARKPALTRQPTAMEELIRTTADLVARTLHTEVKLDLQTQTADGAPLLALADANQLEQALVNLALNARDAMQGRGARPGDQPPARPSDPATPVVFRLRHVVLMGEWPAFPQDIPPGDYVVLEVIDRGCGMPPEVLHQALDPFFTTKDVGQGTGLGLPMVFGIVQGHQGSLAIDTVPGQGTRVSLYLPRLLTERPSRPAADFFETGQILEPEANPGHTILVVDDEEAVQDVVRRFLEIAGHRVLCAGGGQEAFELLATGRPIDLVILDLMMPREDGTSTFERLRQRWPNLPVLLCTGLPQPDPAPKILQAGAVGLLRKPFRMNELWYAVKQALSGQ